MRELKIKGMLLGAIAGDAIGTPFDGLSKAHIHAVYKSINNFTDATPALKGRLQDWKKSGLYSSASQLMLLLLSYVTGNKRMNAYDFKQFISNIPETAENGYMIFRHPDSMLRHFLHSTTKEIASSEENKYLIPSARTSIILIPFSIIKPEIEEDIILSILRFSLMLHKDASSAAGAVLFIMVLEKIINEKSHDIANLISSAIDAGESLYEKASSITKKISEAGISPNLLLASVKDYLNVLSQIRNTKDIPEAEKIIVKNINTKIKTPVTRATIDHPLAIIPFAIFLSTHAGEPSRILFRAAEYGGSASILCALTGALTGALLGTDWLQGNLLDDLVNKKRIINLVDSAVNGKLTDALIGDFIQCEASLTAKEIQEKNAKLKHVKIKTKKSKKKSRKDIERELSAHVVESWTKFDKAKWRKKTKKINEYE